jgi:hypothetical protein
LTAIGGRAPPSHKEGLDIGASKRPMLSRATYSERRGERAEFNHYIPPSTVRFRDERHFGSKDVLTGRSRNWRTGGSRRVAGRVLHSCWRRCRGVPRPVFVNTSVTGGGIPSAPFVCTGVATVRWLVRPRGTGTTIAVAGSSPSSPRRGPPFRPCASSIRSAPNRRRCPPRGRSRPSRDRQGTSSRRSPGTTSPSTAPTRRHRQ